MGRKLNPGWDDGLARERLKKVGIPLGKRIGKLSGGQQAQVALAVAIAKRPQLLLLDEPVAALDPLARREFLEFLMEAVADNPNLTVLLSSHIIGDLERTCDFLIILSSATVRLAADIDHVMETHKRLIGPASDAASIAHLHNVVQAIHAPRQTSLLVRTNGHIWDPSWEVGDVSLEDIVLAYLGQSQNEAGTYVQPREEISA